MRRGNRRGDRFPFLRIRGQGGQALAVSMLLEYLKTGLGEDFAALVPAGAE